MNNNTSDTNLPATEALSAADWSKEIDVLVPEDLLSASVVFHIPQHILTALNREDLKKTALLKLRQNRVQFGIDMSILDGELITRHNYCVAQARLPVDGKDSEISLIEIPERKPEVNQDGSTDFYNVNLIPPVAKDDWLGEKKAPIPGNAGTNVKGLVIEPKEGKDLLLLYDSESVYESEEDGLTVLRALRAGVPHVQDDRISVLSHRDYTNVDFSTGSISFEGSVTIKGAVVDGFSVHATGDISILGEMGIGAVGEIVSLEGSVFIKGGIAGSGKAVVRAARDIFTKFVLDSTLTAGGKVSIGLFCRNSQIKGEEVVIESSRGRIQGGRTEATTLITAKEAGSEMEARTELVILGFRREHLNERLEELRTRWNEHKQQLDANRAHTTSLGMRKDLDAATVKKLLTALKGRMTESLMAMKALEVEMKNVQRYLKMKNEGELHISKINPNCCLIHNDLGYEIRERKVGRMFYCSAGLLIEK